MKRKEVLIAVIGGCFGAVITMVVGLFTPMGVVAQSQPTDAEFDKITCRRIEVVDASGKMMGVMDTDEHGGRVHVWGKDGKVKVYMLADEDGGDIGVYDMDSVLPRIHIHTNERGGNVVALGKDGMASMSIGVYGGHVYVSGKYRESVSGRESVSMHGGRVDVFGKGSDTARASMGVNEYGNGAVSTWDKNGYRHNR